MRVKNFYDGELPKIPPIDWITLASLRESENIALHLKDPSQEVPGVTFWTEVTNWFKKSGFKGVETFSFSITGFSPNLVDQLNKYIESGFYVVTLISASILSNGFSSGTRNLPDHWVVWTDKLREANGNPITKELDPNKTLVSLKLFSWGENRQRLGKNISYTNFCKNIFFAMVVKRESF